jgi:1-deoxy-D-xylulose-5-phosphate synthase
MTVMAPKNRYEMSLMMEYAFKHDGPVAIKYPRGAAYYELKTDDRTIEYGKGEVIFKGKKVAIVAV